MIYSFKYQDATLEFVRNQGRALIKAQTPDKALVRARELFSHMRDIIVKPKGPGEFLVSFKVSLTYRIALLTTVKKVVRFLRSMGAYSRGRCIDRYILASICLETGKPEWLKDINLKTEISELRKGAVVAREVANILRFVDWDIVIYNYIELNSRQGHRSRVVRKVQA